MSAVVETVELGDALTILSASAYQEGGEGPWSVHTMRGPFGARWDLSDARQYLREADRIWWAPEGSVLHALGHQLMAEKAGESWVAFGVTR